MPAGPGPVPGSRRRRAGHVLDPRPQGGFDPRGQDTPGLAARGGLPDRPPFAYNGSVHSSPRVPAHVTGSSLPPSDDLYAGRPDGPGGRGPRRQLRYRGVVVNDLPGTDYDTLQAVAVDAVGRVIAAGGSRAGLDYGFTVVRYTTYGALDPTFGPAGTGIVFTRPSQAAGATAYGRDIALDAAGRILVAGYGYLPGQYPAFTVARYTPDGRLDPTFGGTGLVQAAFAGDQMTGSDMALDGAGRIVVVGTVRIAGGDEEMAVVRFNSDGSLDTGFGIGGRVVTRLSPGNDIARGVAIDGAGRIVVAGIDGTIAPFGRLCVLRYLPDGSPDPSFGTGGVVTGLPYGGANGLTIDGAGGLLVTATTPGFQHPVVLRFLPDGSPDPAFGVGGEVVVSPGPASVGVLGRIRLDAAGRIVAAGGLHLSGTDPSQFLVVRLTPDGTPDPTFDGDGLVLTDVPYEYDLAFNVGFDGAGRIVAAGTSQDSSDPNPADQFRFVVARYLGDDAPNDPVNRPPNLTVPLTATALPATPLTFTATATDFDRPAQTLTFSLVGAPAGAAIDPVTGAFTWAPDPDTPDGDYPIQVRVTDDGSPALSDTRTVTVTVTRALVLDYDVLTGGTLTVAGTNGADDIRVYQSGPTELGVTVNGTAYGPFSTYVARRFVARGFAGDDRLEADAALNFNVTLLGGDGADTLLGGFGGDLLDGEGGADLLFGRESTDILVGGPGDDRLAGGPGDDRYAFGRDWGRDTITEAGGAGLDTLDFSGADVPGVTTTVGGRVVVTAGGNRVTTNGRTVENLIASPGSADVLQFGDGDNVWRLVGVVNERFFYSGVEILRGGAGRDRFVTARWSG